jgi:hypothetical protein
MSKTMVILVGPQGAGNHLFAKVLSLHPEVFGWKELLDKNWSGHDQEPFAEYWKDPKKLKDFDWNQSNYYVTSISCPYFDNGKEEVPKFVKFINALQQLDIDVKVAIVGRDQNILRFQQKRVRGKITLNDYYGELKKLSQYYPLFISQELLQLNGHHYLEFLQNYLKIPVTTKGPAVKKIIKENANLKYIVPAKEGKFDELAKISSSKHD